MVCGRSIGWVCSLVYRGGRVVTQKAYYAINS